MDYVGRSARISPIDISKIIKTKIGIKEDLLQETEELQLRWRGRVMRMEDCRIVKQVAEGNPQGQRRSGRPVRT
jgi:hypothetical protein